MYTRCFGTCFAGSMQNLIYAIFSQSRLLVDLTIHFALCVLLYKCNGISVYYVTVNRCPLILNCILTSRHTANNYQSTSLCILGSFGSTLKDCSKQIQSIHMLISVYKMSIPNLSKDCAINWIQLKFVYKIQLVPGCSFYGLSSMPLNFLNSEENEEI